MYEGLGFQAWDVAGLGQKTLNPKPYKVQGLGLKWG